MRYCCTSCFCDVFIGLFEFKIVYFQLVKIKASEWVATPAG
ncbi:hypothetical protein C3B79_0552 [Aeromonas hydrophila]|nr:hypothetical protein C3B79_0552 [Aeromonas hydrophila]